MLAFRQKYKLKTVWMWLTDKDKRSKILADICGLYPPNGEILTIFQFTIIGPSTDTVASTALSCYFRDKALYRLKLFWFDSKKEGATQDYPHRLIFPTH